MFNVKYVKVYTERIDGWFLKVCVDSRFGHRRQGPSYICAEEHGVLAHTRMLGDRVTRSSLSPRQVGAQKQGREHHLLTERRVNFWIIYLFE